LAACGFHSAKGEPMADLVIRAATVAGVKGVRDVAIRDGHIMRIGHDLSATGSQEIHAQGRLLSPGFVDAHMHLDKSLVGENLPYTPAGSLAERIEIARRIQWETARQNLRQRAFNLLSMAVCQGTTAIRSHVDIDPVVGLKNFEAVSDLRERYRGLVDIQIVAFPQSGILRAPGTLPLLEKALREGADVIGGIDPGGFDGDIQKHLQLVFDLAGEFDVDIDFHLHDPGHLGIHTIRQIAKRTIAAGMQGRVALGHVFCLGEVGETQARELIPILQEAGIHIISAPHTSRPLPPIPLLLEAGVNTLLASDNVQDAWSPFGRADLLERVLLVAYRYALRNWDELAALFDTITHNPAQTVGLSSGYGISVGSRADLVLLDAPSLQQAIIRQAARNYVIKAGRVVVEDGRLVHYEGATSRA
jgi:cytosine deaminase